MSEYRLRSSVDSPIIDLSKPAFDLYADQPKVEPFGDERDEQVAQIIESGLRSVPASGSVVFDVDSASGRLLGAILDAEAIRDDTSYSPVDLGPVLDDDVSGPQPSLLHRSDGSALLYPGRVHLLHGPPESGKTWLALAAIAERLYAGEAAAIVDFEMTETEIVSRLLTMGIDPDKIREQFVYVRPDEALDVDGWKTVGEALTTAGCTLVVVDGVTEAMAIHGLEINSNSDAAQLGLRFRALADSGLAVVAVDHVTKSSEARGRGPIGAQHKLAAADVAFSIQTLVTPDPTRTGKLLLRVQKDRPGRIRAVANQAGLVAEIDLIPGDGLLAVIVEPPAERGTFRPTRLMAKVSAFLEQRTENGDDPPSTRQIQAGVHGRKEYVAQAVQTLIDEGHVTTRTGSRSATIHDLVEPFEDSP